MTTLTCQQALDAARVRGLDRLDAQLLLLHAMGKPASDRAWLMAHDSDVLDAISAELFLQYATRRATGEPLAYIVGYKEFFGLQLQVDARVLVPRPDTETLVEWALTILVAMAGKSNPTQPLQVLDLGTGSGAIALALAHNLATRAVPASVLAVDASTDALAVANANARQLLLPVVFLESHWFDKVGGHQHVIASNPPYVAAQDPHLAALCHEPLQALTAGGDGLDDIRQIIDAAPLYLHAGGWLLLEHGYDQSARVSELLQQRGFSQVQHRLDLAGITRCTGGQFEIAG